MGRLRTAIVHDWLTGMRGGEKCLEVFLELFPDAPIYTLFHKPGSVSESIESHEIVTSFIQRLPLASRRHQRYLGLLPLAVEEFDLRDYDLILSSSHCVAKGAIPGAGARHICYCYTPMRYVWEMHDEYSSSLSYPLRLVFRALGNYLRIWDVASAARVDSFVASSAHVKERIKRYYRRDSVVVHPWVDTDFFTPGDGKGDYSLVVSALVPYKRVDLAVQAFNKLGSPLYVVGEGPEKKKLLKMANDNIKFTGWVSLDDLLSLYRNCRALIFPGIEDFGIVPLEAQACGKPVIAFGRGGVLETVVEGETGVFFHEQNWEVLAESVERFRRMEFSPDRLRAQATSFSRSSFKQKIAAMISEASGEEPEGVALVDQNTEA